MPCRARIASIAAFVLISLPLLGIVQNGPQIAADRYTYHSSIALAPLFAGMVVVADRRWRSGTRTGSAFVALILATLTVFQVGVWRDSESLWKQAVTVDPQSSIANGAYAGIMFGKGRYDEASRLPNAQSRQHRTNRKRTMCTVSNSLTRVASTRP